MDVTLRQLRTIREVADRRTIAAAAASLGYTPSAVSQQLASLERALGVELLEKVGRNVRLTDAGRALVEHATAVLDRADATRAVVEQALAVPAGDVRLSVFPSFAASLLPELLVRLADDHPALLVRSVELDPDVAPDAVAAGRVDLALVLGYPHATVPRPTGIEWRTLWTEPFRLVVPEGDPLDGSVDLAELAGRPFVAGPLSSSCGRFTVNACRAAGFEPDVRHEIDGFDATLQLVAAGAGVTLAPDLVLLDPPPGVRLLELDQPLHRTIELAARPSSLARPAVRAVVDVVEEVLGRAPALSR